MTITQAIIPVAGLGTRFLPWTKVVPKELLPIGNRPVISLIVDECLEAGIREICFVISEGKESIPRYFQIDTVFEAEIARRGKSDAIAELQKYNNVHFHTVYQNTLDGDGHAILQAKDWVNSDRVAILFGDDLVLHTRSALSQMITAMENIKDNDQFAAMFSLAEVS